jgi:hypothetical protein
VRVTDESRLADLARAWEAKYGPDWHFDVADGAFHHGGGSAWVFEIVPDSAFSFGRSRTARPGIASATDSAFPLTRPPGSRDQRHCEEA